MEQIPIRRVCKGMITIPDFAVKHFIEESQTVFGLYKGEKMTLTLENLINDKVKEGPISHGYLRDTPYSLWYYKWQPDED